MKVLPHFCLGTGELWLMIVMGLLPVIEAPLLGIEMEALLVIEIGQSLPPIGVFSSVI